MSHDYAALSSPFYAMEEDVRETYRLLDEAWEEAARAFRELPSLPVDAYLDVTEVFDHPNSPVRKYLGWEKHGGRRRFTLNTCCDGDRDVPRNYEEWSGEERIKLYDKIPDLFRRAEDFTRRFIEVGKELKARSLKKTIDHDLAAKQKAGDRPHRP